MRGPIEFIIEILTRPLGSTTGKFTKVTVSGCGETDTECVLLRNSVANITIDFESGEWLRDWNHHQIFFDNGHLIFLCYTYLGVTSSKLTTVVHGNIAGIDMPFPLQDPDACAAGVQCPIASGTSYEYMASLPILKAYPKIKVIVKWELKDENNADVVCVKIPARIK